MEQNPVCCMRLPGTVVSPLSLTHGVDFSDTWGRISLTGIWRNSAILHCQENAYLTFSELNSVESIE